MQEDSGSDRPGVLVSPVGSEPKKAEDPRTAKLRALMFQQNIIDPSDKGEKARLKKAIQLEKERLGDEDIDASGVETPSVEDLTGDQLDASIAYLSSASLGRYPGETGLQMRLRRHRASMPGKDLLAVSLALQKERASRDLRDALEGEKRREQEGLSGVKVGSGEEKRGMTDEEWGTVCILRDAQRTKGVVESAPRYSGEDMKKSAREAIIRGAREYYNLHPEGVAGRFTEDSSLVEAVENQAVQMAGGADINDKLKATGMLIYAGGLLAGASAKEAAELAADTLAYQHLQNFGKAVVEKPHYSAIFHSAFRLADRHLPDSRIKGDGIKDARDVYKAVKAHMAHIDKPEPSK